MTMILTGGVGKDEVAALVTGLGLAGVDVRVSDDMDAAVQLRTGQADYYLGTCHTGAGASLGVLPGLLGSGACHSFGRGTPSGDEIGTLLADGRRAFGLSVDRIDVLVPALARAIAEGTSR